MTRLNLGRFKKSCENCFDNSSCKVKEEYIHNAQPYCYAWVWNEEEYVSDIRKEPIRKRGARDER